MTALQNHLHEIGHFLWCAQQGHAGPWQARWDRLAIRQEGGHCQVRVPDVWSFEAGMKGAVKVAMK